MTRRRWIAEHWDEATASISGTQAEHMARVLRAHPGMEADVVAGGRVFHAQVAAVALHEIRFNLIAEVEADPALPVTLVMSIYKFDRMEWAIEKCTELNVTTILPVIAQRTETHLALAADKRVERWRRISREAAEQSRRKAPPEIGKPIKLSGALTCKAGLRIALAEAQGEKGLSEVLRSRQGVPSLALAVGPEGGWTADEVQAFDQSEWIAASLGHTILRAETAAIAAMAVARASCT